MQGRWRWWLVRSLFVAVLGAGVLAALAGCRYYPAYRSALSARENLQEAQALLRDRRLDASADDLAVVEARLDEAEEDFRTARGAFGDPLLQAGQRLPLAGATLRATVDLTEIGLEGTGIGRDAVAMARAYQRLRDEREGTLPERVREIFTEMEPSMTGTKERLERIREERDRLAGAALPPPFADAVRDLDDDLLELDELVRTYDGVSVLLPDFLGFNGPRTYLLLAQNNAELLPTGGLISVYGIITVRDGRIQEKFFEDAVAFGARWLESNPAYVEPPPPLKRYLLRDYSWNLAVSNWSPHFPTAAQDAERLFRLAGGRPVDGVIAINVRTIEELLRVTGPIAMASYGVTVSAENALDVIEEHTRTALEPEDDRKAFVGTLADELLSRLMHASPEQWTPLIDALDLLRQQRQILLFFHDPVLQTLGYQLGLAGALEAPHGDYFMLVDASVNSTKLNIALDQRIDLTIGLDEQGNAEHEATVTYRNDLPAWALGRDPQLVSRLMLGGLYGGYVRVLAPAGSRHDAVLLDGREVGPDELGIEQGKTVFGRFFSLASGQQAQLAFSYATPGIVPLEGGRAEYRLYLQKQSGTGPIPLRLRLILPENAQLQSAELDGKPVTSLTGIETDLREDRELMVRYTVDR